ncbi:MAG TPA: DNA methyltransferase [Bacilli bacterium]|nr:DNA methyltransferase [Bacilli bacterium]
MAISAYSPQFESQPNPKVYQGSQMDLLASIWDTTPCPTSQREEAGTFALSFSPLMVRHLIHTYSRMGDTVLDCFLGTGTTLVEAQLMGRKAIGLDCNEEILENAKQRVLTPTGQDGPQFYCADARHLSSVLAENSVDLVVTQPPYGSTYQFSAHNPHDLSRLSSRDFLHAIEQVAEELHRVLKPGGICALLIGDIKDRGRMVPLGFQFIHRFLSRGFSVKVMHDYRATGQNLPVSLQDHEYLFVFEKNEKAPKRPRTVF